MSARHEHEPIAGRTESFFADLARRGREPLLRRASGTVRFDVGDGGSIAHWSVTMREGEVQVSRRNLRADAVVHIDGQVMDDMVSGRVNAMAATLRGDLVPEGDLGLVMLFQRVFPAPPGPEAREDADG